MQKIIFLASILGWFVADDGWISLYEDAVIP
jgi:hypothetical protein